MCDLVSLIGLLIGYVIEILVPFGIARSRRRSQTVEREERAPPDVEHDVEEESGGGGGGRRRRRAQLPHGARQEVHPVQRRVQRLLLRLVR